MSLKHQRDDCKAFAENGLIRILAGDQDWLLERPGNLEEIWEKIALEDEDKIPYWVELWPASIAMAEWLTKERNQIKGRLCVDLGCGLGLTALAGQKAGAFVSGVDCETDALKFCKINAANNKMAQPLWILMDWRRPAFRSHIFWRVWASDVAYERRFWQPLLNFADHCLMANGKFWLADPGRSVFDSFIEKARMEGWLAEKMLTQRAFAIDDNKRGVDVNVWELVRGWRVI